MSQSRQNILNRLQTTTQPFPQVSSPPETYQHMVPLSEHTPAALRARFITEAEKLACVVHQVTNDEEALAILLKIIGEETAVLSWESSQIPLPGFAPTLAQAGITIADVKTAVAGVGITGVDAALAATGTLLLGSGVGKHRATSLLPPIHIAILNQSQILPDMEAWVSQQRQNDLKLIQEASNIILISGPSRTADIGMELIMGMHGPRELHIILRPLPSFV